MLMSKKERAVRTVGWYIGAVLICCITVFPFLWMIATSFKTIKEIYDNSLSLIPQYFTWENYRVVFSEIPFGRYILNSSFLAITLSFTNVFFGSLAGYSFAKLRYRGKQIAFILLLSSMMMPGIVTMLPSFLVLKNFPLAGGNDIFGKGGTGFINTYWAIILPRCVGAYSCFFMRQFFETLPDDIAESARIDGCNEFGIFTRIYFPLIRPAVITLFIMNFQSAWNSFMWPSIVLNKQEYMTIQVGLRAFKYEYDTNYGALMAGTVVATVPLLIIFSFAQRYYVQGIAFSGGKE